MNSQDKLEQLWQSVTTIHDQRFRGHSLMPILGGGQTERPKIMFVFINPTVRNISSDPNWQGPRYPFIGTKQIWRVFHKSGLFDDRLIEEIEKNGTWSVAFANRVLDFLRSKSFYFTNLVKWTGHDATLPDSKKIHLFLPILKEEIRLIQPKYIVTFGSLPFSALAGRPINITEYYQEAMKKRRLRLYELDAANLIPCYFPIGRGNPRRAIEILQLADALE